MNYLFLECAQGTAEYTFWKYVIEFSGKIICCGGNTHMIKDLRQYGSFFKNGDNVFICYDSINMYSSVTGKTVVSNIKILELTLLQYSKSKGIRGYLCKDLCFESMLLRLSKIINKSDSDSDLQKCFKRLYAREKILPKHLRILFTPARTMGVTNEEFTSSLLHNLTCNSNLRITKGALGRCWTSSCGYITKGNVCKLAYNDIDNKSGFCGPAQKDFCILCGHLFNSKYDNLIFDTRKQGYKQDMILSELCDGDWYNLFERIK